VSRAEADDQVPAHDGLFYSSDEQLLRFAVPFLRDGIAHGEAVVIVANDDTRELLEPALEGLGPVEFVSPHAVFTRTATAVRAYRDLVEEALARGAQRVRAISEVNFGTTTHAQAESIRFEAVANLALAAHPLWNVCLYDVRRIPAELLTASAHAHPYLVTDDHRRPNPDYLPPVELLRRHSQIGPYTIEAQPPSLELHDLHAVGLSTLRRTIHNEATAGSVLPQDQIDDFLEAISEIASNALVHGTGQVSVRAWVTQQRLVCTITDHGSGFDDPLAGFLPAPLNGLPVHGAGLWLARNFSDSLDFSTTADGFTARIACWTN
jgi:anti-sigma regulatory factor (Ser/Thr protein kinase)